MDFSAVAARAADHAPHAIGEQPTVPGRILRADGDGLAYYCSGGEGVTPGEARGRLVSKLLEAKKLSGAESIVIEATHNGSHKGHRYAVARVKPYQGQRTHGQRPANWQHLRDIYDSGSIGGIPVVQTMIAEADDQFSRYSREDQVIYTQDKDMRMVEGYHLDWMTGQSIRVPRGAWEVLHGEKVYGRKWFWLQILQGDAVDNVPGLPAYRLFKGDGSYTEKKIGEKTAEKYLSSTSGVHDEGHARIVVRDLYRSFYGDRWLVEMLEQAVLLWMRTDEASDPFNCCAEGNPLHGFINNDLFASAYAEIKERINLVEKYAKAENYGGGTVPCEPADEAGDAVCAVPAPVPDGQGGAGSQPQYGTSSGSPAPELQLPAGVDREGHGPVRSDEPRRIRAWGITLLVGQ